jgi:hypothetical protein
VLHTAHGAIELEATEETESSFLHSILSARSG